MDEPILSFVLLQLERCKGRLPRVAEQSGVPYRTLQKIVSGETKDPRVGVVQKLADYFREHSVDQLGQPLPNDEAAGQEAA